MNPSPKILIVDDNPNNRLALRTVLKGLAELHEASNGFDALSMSLEEDYAIILLDVQMPEMDGFEVCEQLRTNPKTADTPVIFLSAAYKEDVDKTRGYVAGATGYLTKPIDDHILKSKVQVFLRLYRQKEMLQEIAQARSEFLANMSHEIRTPMNAIMGLSKLALNKEMPDGIRDYLEKINAASESLLGILNDILDLSKIEAGMLSVEKSPFSLGDLLHNLHNLYSLRAEEKNIAFSIEVDQDTPDTLLGDALRIQQIVSNLLSNALKFTEQGKVETRVALMASSESRATLRFSVSDTGIGISLEDQAKLFRPFSQADASITRRFGGTGLGLSISRKLLQFMGSEFHIESQPGKGTTFSFDLNLEVAPPELRQTGNRRHAERRAGALADDLRERGRVLSGARVLVAEDNRINQQVVKEFLQFGGVTVDIANDGKEALQLLENHLFDAILMDVHMPGMGGLEATEQIRLQERFRDLPIIALTAGVTQQEREKCLACGMNDFVTKPVAPEELIRVLCHWVVGQHGVAAEAQPVEESLSKRPPMLGDLPEFDFSNILSMVGGNETLVINLLKTFRNESRVASRNIAEQIGHNDLAAAEELVHAIKGSAGNLGALDLHAAAEALDAGLKQGQLNQVAYDNFQAVLLRTEDALARLD